MMMLSRSGTESLGTPLNRRSVGHLLPKAREVRHAALACLVWCPRRFDGSS